MKKVIFINSHPIQYYAPMYKYMTAHGVETECWYGDDGGVRENFDKEFGVKIKWDIDLLDGYRARFFDNYSWKPGHDKGFFGLMNFGVLRALRREPPAVIVVHGWHYVTNLLVLLFAGFFGHKVGIRCDAPELQERMKTGFAQRIKRFGLQYLVFSRVDYFCYIGEQNRQFYANLGARPHELIFCPFCVDNDRFQRSAANGEARIEALRQKLGIPADRTVLLFSGKYIEKKRPLDLLAALGELPRSTYHAVLIGEGELRPAMEQYISSHGLEDEVTLTGFVNQSVIVDYYGLGDIFVLCSGFNETWGLVVNEALNFDLALVVSHLPGSGYDLVRPGENGYGFPTGDVHALKNVIRQARQLLRDRPEEVRRASRELLDIYNFQTNLVSLKSLAVGADAGARV